MFGKFERRIDEDLEELSLRVKAVANVVAVEQVGVATSAVELAFDQVGDR